MLLAISAVLFFLGAIIAASYERGKILRLIIGVIIMVLSFYWFWNLLTNQ